MRNRAATASAPSRTASSTWRSGMHREDRGAALVAVFSRQRSPTSLSRVRCPMEISFARHQFPPDIIRHAVWLYLRFTLSFRDVEDLLAERGLDVSYETIRRWV